LPLQAQHSTAQHGTARRGTAHHSMAQHGTAVVHQQVKSRSAEQDSQLIAWDSRAQHSMSQWWPE